MEELAAVPAECLLNKIYTRFWKLVSSHSNLSHLHFGGKGLQTFFCTEQELLFSNSSRHPGPEGTVQVAESSHEPGAPADEGFQ